MDDRSRLIKLYPLVNMQGGVGSTYNAAQDVATQGVLVLQPKVRKRGRFVLRYRFAVDHGINACNTHNNETY